MKNGNNTPEKNMTKPMNIKSNLALEETEAIEGYKTEEEIQETEKSISVSSTSQIMIAAILICIEPIYYEWKKGR